MKYCYVRIKGAPKKTFQYGWDQIFEQNENKEYVIKYFRHIIYPNKFGPFVYVPDPTKFGHWTYTDILAGRGKNLSCTYLISYHDSIEEIWLDLL